MERPIKMIR